MEVTPMEDALGTGEFEGASGPKMSPRASKFDLSAVVPTLVRLGVECLEAGSNSERHYATITFYKLSLWKFNLS
jgi:hypothetical protein